MCSGLRFRQAPGGPKIEVLRPQNASRSQYLDSDEAPTLVTFEDTAGVDIPSLLATGAIVPWVPPKPARAVKEPDDG